RPGGNATGFALFEYSFSGKWIELLKEIAPGVTRAAVLRDPSVGSGAGQYAIIQAAAQPLGVELRPMDVRDPGEVERHRGVRAGAERWSDPCRSPIIGSSATGVRPLTSTASSEARSRPTFRCRHRPSTNSLSISRPRKRWALPCPIACSPAPTR